MNHKHAILLSLIMLIGMSMFPFGASPNVVSRKDPMEQVTPAEITPRNIRVAIYNETNFTKPTWAYDGLFTQDSTDIAQVLEDAGYQVELLTFQDLLDHRLIVADFDVFVLPNNLPRENVTMLAKEFWLAGGGLLTVDSAASFLGYAGVVPYESEGNHGYDSYWYYNWSEIQTVASLHPVTKRYSTGDTINVTDFEWATFNWSALSATSEYSHYTKLLNIEGQPNNVTGFAYDPLLRGGKVVHLPGFVANTSDTRYMVQGIRNLCIDAVEWLCPVPKSRIAYDLSHHPRNGIDPWDEEALFPSKFGTFRNLLVNHSFTVDKLYPSPEGNLTQERLEPYDVLILVLPEYNFTDDERTAVQSWVHSGGSLLTMSESLSYQSANIKPVDQINQLMGPFDMEIVSGLNWSVTASIVKHPIRDRASQVYMDCVGPLNITEGAFPLVEKDEDVFMAGSEYGNGRVVLSGGMNWPGHIALTSLDNRHWALNVLNWLGASEADTLLYCDNLISDDFYDSPASKALNELGVDYFLVTDASNLNLTLHEYEWDRIIIDSVVWDVSGSIEPLIEHLENGGYLAMACSNFDNSMYEPLLNMMGASQASNYPFNSEFYIWEEDHPVFQTPVNVSTSSFSTVNYYWDDGDELSVLDNATALGGSTSYKDETAKAALAVRNDGKTVVMGYMFDQIDGDNDNSSYADSFEMWLNTVSHIFAPSVDSPSDKTIELGTTGEFITWHPSSYRPDSFIIEENGVVIDSATWNGGDISQPLDGYEAGTYNFTLIVEDVFGQTTSDRVRVVVEDTIPPALNSPSDVEFTEGDEGHFVNWT
ncbi:MAG: hypothetical protein KGY80_06525, partial [Candidatus Thorarchaeota archaeon]|nr:hypothetical protein [Candidatus Thorarchaeota archaeon]